MMTGRWSEGVLEATEQLVSPAQPERERDYMGILRGTGGGGGAQPHTHTHQPPPRRSDPREGTTHGDRWHLSEDKWRGSESRVREGGADVQNAANNKQMQPDT